MSYATASDVTARIPGASAVDADVLGLALDDAATEIGLGAYGGRALIAHVYLTAHIVAYRTGALGGAGGGQVSSRKLGGIAVTYAVAPPTDPDALATTAWGRAFMRIRDSIIGYPIAI